jgi:hypothetical protein
MKTFYGIIALTLLPLCIPAQSEFYEIVLTEKSVVEISPDSIALEKIRLEMGDEDFYVMTDDVMWYRAQSFNVMDSLKIKFVNTDKKLVRIITRNKTLEFNADTTNIKWWYFYYNGIELKEKDIFDIINISEFYK